MVEVSLPIGSSQGIGPDKRSVVEETAQMEQPVWYKDRKVVKLAVFAVLVAIFAATELICGVALNSLVLLADSLHVCSDLVSLFIGMAATRMAGRKRNHRFTFGMARFETLGALINAIALVAIAFLMLLEALEHLVDQSELKDPKSVVIVGCFGIAMNIFGIFFFGNDHGHSHGVSQLCPCLPRLFNRSPEPLDNQIRRPTGYFSVDSLGDEENSSEAQYDVEERETERTIPNDDGGNDGLINRMFDYIQHNHNSDMNGSILTEDTHTNVDQYSLEECQVDRNAHHNHDHYNNSDIDLRTNHNHDHHHNHDSDIDPKFNHNHNHHHHHHHNHEDENMFVIYVHILGDFLSSSGVVLSGILNMTIQENHRYLVDPLITATVAMMFVTAAMPVVLRTSRQLMQIVPSHVDLYSLAATLKTLPIVSYHQLRIWQLVGPHVIGTVHITLDSHVDVDTMTKTIQAVEDAFHAHGIQSVTVQAAITSVRGSATTSPSQLQTMSRPY